MKDRFKSSGSHKVCIVARVDSVPENHFNLKVLLNSLNLHELSKDFIFSCDLKLIDILLGIQSCSSLHPCPYYEGNKINRCGEKTNKKGIWVKENPWTMKSLTDSFSNWVHETGSNRKLLKHYFNVEHLPIYVRNGQENVEIWSVYPPLQLHTGFLGSQ